MGRGDVTGQGGVKCTHNCRLPVTLRNTDGQPVIGTYDTPTVINSQLPALLGLTAARESRMVIATMTHMSTCSDRAVMIL